MEITIVDTFHLIIIAGSLISLLSIGWWVKRHRKKYHLSILPLFVSVYAGVISVAKLSSPFAHPFTLLYGMEIGLSIFAIAMAGSSLWVLEDGSIDS